MVASGDLGRIGREEPRRRVELVDGEVARIDVGQVIDVAGATLAPALAAGGGMMAISIGSPSPLPLPSRGPEGLEVGQSFSSGLWVLAPSVAKSRTLRVTTVRP